MRKSRILVKAKDEPVRIKTRDPGVQVPGPGIEAGKKISARRTRRGDAIRTRGSGKPICSRPSNFSVGRAAAFREFVSDAEDAGLVPLVTLRSKEDPHKVFRPRESNTIGRLTPALIDRYCSDVRDAEAGVYRDYVSLTLGRERYCETLQDWCWCEKVSVPCSGEGCLPSRMVSDFNSGDRNLPLTLRRPHMRGLALSPKDPMVRFSGVFYTDWMALDVSFCEPMFRFFLIAPTISAPIRMSFREFLDKWARKSRRVHDR